MAIIDGYDVDTQERVLLEDKDDAGLNAEFMRDVKQTSVGKRFFADFMSEDNYIAVLEAVGKLYPNADCITVSMFADSAETLMLSGEIRPTSEPELAPVEQAPVPTDRNGRKLSQSQIKWGEMTRFANEHSSREVKERARIDVDFASFVRTNLHREMNEQGVGDAAVNLNSRPQSNDRVIPELARWVEEYRRMPVAEVRRRSRADYNPAGYEHFNRMLNLAAAGGLI